MVGHRLTVEFVGETYTVEAGQALTFGRTADVVIDDANQYLHRVVGRFWWHDGFWWLENLGRHVELEVESDQGIRARLAPSDTGETAVATPLTGGKYHIAFAAGGLRYAIEAHLGEPSLPSVGIPPSDGDETSRFGHVELTADERALLIALAEPVLRDPASAGPDVLAANRELALRLGWTLTKFNRKLDYLCVRLTRAGVRGLQGGRGSEATNRRWRLVEHAVAARLVGPQDLST